MYLNVTINDRVNVKVAPVSIYEMRAIQRDVRNKSILVDGAYQGVIDEGDNQVERVITEGGTQVARVITEGDTQVAIVIAEGDTQVARVLVYADEAEDFSGEALASSLDSDAWSNTTVDVDVINWTWDSVNNALVQTPIVGARSAKHWMEKAQLVASGLSFQGTWAMDASCTFPADGVENGEFYIINQVDPACTTYLIGDWIIWNGLVYQKVSWSFSWAIAKDVTVEGTLPAVGDDLARNGTAYTKAEQDAIDLIQDTAIALNTAKVTGSDRVLQTEYDTEQGTQDTAIALNTNKISYKDTMTFDGTTLAITIG